MALALLTIVTNTWPPCSKAKEFKAQNAIAKQWEKSAT